MIDGDLRRRITFMSELERVEWAKSLLPSRIESVRLSACWSAPKKLIGAVFTCEVFVHLGI